MKRFAPRTGGLAALVTCGLLLPTFGLAGEPAWVELLPAGDLDAFRKPHPEWAWASTVSLKDPNPKRLTWEPGQSAIVNGKDGNLPNLVTKQQWADLEVECEFLVAKNSNAGVKLMGLYEVQIYDSHGKAKPTARDCGGVYPRADLQPSYHLIDDGYPPLRQAAKPAGAWQTLSIRFRAPRFDGEGKKVANAVFEEVRLNGEIVQKELELPYATGHAWRKPEIAKGPLLLQADHGPVAFRDLRVRPFAGE